MNTRITLAALAALVTVAACGGGGDPIQPPGPPAKVETITSPSSSTAIATSAGPFAVRVTDANGTAVPTVTVNFTVSGGTASPSSVVTDAAGEARSVITAGNTAGTVVAVATVASTAIQTSVTISAVPGPLANIVLAPEAVRLNAIGDTLRLTVLGVDAGGNSVPTGPITFTSTDQSAVTVTTLGTVRAMKVDASAMIIASNGTKADTALVSVIGPNSSVCTGLATPRLMSLGEVTVFRNVANACLTGAPSGSEFTMIAFNGDTLATQSTTITGSGLASPPSTNNALAPTAATAFRGATGAQATLVSDVAFHTALQEKTRALRTRFAGARQWQRARRQRSSSTLSATGSAPSYSAIGTSPTVGTILKLNVNGNDACANPDVRAVRIVAVGTKAVVMADTANPAGGFTTADYERFAAQFDTLVYPLDVANFGAPSDIDGNSRVGILFTRAVNELTPPNNPSYVGGFFFSRDLFPKGNTPEFGTGCTGSNEGEMFYMLAPDPSGVVNGNVRSTAMVTGLTMGTIAHEFQHLINASRRIYVNTGATDYEVVWLNEGLSHIAEELLYYKETGKGPRMNLTDANIRLESTTNYNLWKQDAAQNFQRFYSYLQDPEGNSPTAEDDELATRGATWSFLRYAADRLYPNDGDVWFRLVNSTTEGLKTLRLAFGTDQVSLFRDWATANYVDDTGLTTSIAYLHQSWNFRDIYTKTFVAGVYPLKVTGLTSGASRTVSVRQTSAAYLRFAVPANADGLIRLSASGAAPSGSLQFVVVRTK